MRGKLQVWIEAGSRERLSTLEEAVRRLLSPRRLWSRSVMLDMVLKALAVVLLSFDVF